MAVNAFHVDWSPPRRKPNFGSPFDTSCILTGEGKSSPAMPAHKKVPLKNIKTLTFYKDQWTAARRTSAIPQLTCVGTPCSLFQPDVVQCTNMGDDGGSFEDIASNSAAKRYKKGSDGLGSSPNVPPGGSSIDPKTGKPYREGLTRSQLRAKKAAEAAGASAGNIQWKCEADLPSSLRLGKVEVSCEGWAQAGDTDILQGSCGLTYDLHRTDPDLYNAKLGLPSRTERFLDRAFNLIFWLVALVMLYSLVRSLLLKFWPSLAPPPASRFLGGGHDHGHGPGGGGGGGGGGGPGYRSGPPPPYTKDETFTTTGSSASTGPGFWTGLMAGGAAAYLAANRGGGTTVRERNPPPPRPSRSVRHFEDDYAYDRGAGSSGTSGLGEIRQSTGFGGTSTR